MTRLSQIFFLLTLLAYGCTPEKIVDGEGGAGGTGPILNTSPVAAAGPSQFVREGSVVTLNAAGSSDADGVIVRYQWEQIVGPAVSIDAAGSEQSTFTAPEILGNEESIRIEIQLTVTDDSGDSATSTTSVNVWDSNRRPVILFEAYPSSAKGTDVVHLDVSGSVDSDGQISSFQWSQYPGEAEGFVVDLADPTAPATAVTLPDVIEVEVIVFQVEVTDNEGKVAVGQATIAVEPKPATLVFRDLPDPVEVEAESVWPILRVEVRNASGQGIVRGTPSTMMISLSVVNGSDELNGITVRRAMQGIAQFNDLSYDTAEEGVVLRAEGEGVVGFSPAINLVTANDPPVITVPDDFSVDALSASVLLDGDAEDPDAGGGIISVLWAQTDGPSVELSNADTTQATFNAPDVAVRTPLTFRLTATDVAGKTRYDSVVVTIEPVAAGLAFLGEIPSPVNVDAIWTNVDVELLNQSGERILDGDAAELTVEVRVADATGNDDALAGERSTVAVAGVASFTNIYYREPIDPGVAIEVFVSDPAITGPTSNQIVVESMLPSAIGTPGGQVRVYTAGPAGDRIASTDILLGGGFSTTTDALDFGFAPTGATMTSVGNSDGFVARYSVDASYDWLYTCGADGATATITGVTTDADSDIIAVSDINGAVNFDPAGTLVPSAAAGDFVGVVGLSGATGAPDWAVAFGGGLEHAHAVAYLDDVTTSGPIVVGSYSEPTANFDPCGDTPTVGATAPGAWGYALFLDTSVIADTGLCATTAASAWLYTPTVHADSVSVAFTDIVVTDDQSIWVIGQFSGTAEFQTGTPLSAHANSSHAVLVKLGTNGAVELAVSFGGDAIATTADAIATDSAGNVYVAGTFGGSGDFDPSAAELVLTATGQIDGYVAAFNSAGELIPGRSFAFGGSTTDDSVAVAGMDIGPEADDGLVVTGSYWGSVDFDPSPSEVVFTTRDGEANGFVLALDPAGALRSAGQMGALDGDLGRDSHYGPVLVLNPSEADARALVCGFTEGIATASVDLDPTDQTVEYEPVGQVDATLVVVPF